MRPVAILALIAVFGAAASHAQGVVAPGTAGTVPVTKGTGVGPDSAATGYSAGGRGGQGGMGGGATTNGTAAGAGTVSGGNPGGYPDQN